MEAKEIRLEAVASLPGTDSSNPVPSSGESSELSVPERWTDPAISEYLDEMTVFPKWQT